MAKLYHLDGKPQTWEDLHRRRLEIQEQSAVKTTPPQQAVFTTSVACRIYSSHVLCEREQRSADDGELCRCACHPAA